MSMNFNAVAKQNIPNIGEVFGCVFGDETRRFIIPDGPSFKWTPEVDIEQFANPDYRPELEINLSNCNMCMVLRDTLGLNGDSSEGFFVEIDVFINLATNWLKRNFGKQSAEVESTQDGRVVECGRREGYENQAIHRMVKVAREGRERGATHISAM